MARVTIRTIAQALGVHPSTVSRALGPGRAGEVSSETAQRIRDFAAAHGYEPDPWARSLRTRRTRTLGLLMPRLTDSVLAVMFEAAEDRARERGYQAVTLSTRDHQHEERRLVELLLDRRVDGLILATVSMDDPLLPDIDGRGVPFVLLNRASGGYPCVRVDDEVGGYLATRHLLSQGHRRVGMLSGPPDVSTASFRLEGYRRAHAELGVPLDAALVVPSTFTLQGGVEAATRVLTLPRRPTALVTVNDATAVGAMAVARDLNLRVPHDLAVVGYNDTDLAPMLPVPLSSVSVPLDEMGRLAVDTLVESLVSTGAPPEGRVFTPHLVVRASSLTSGSTSGRARGSPADASAAGP